MLSLGPNGGRFPFPKAGEEGGQREMAEEEEEEEQHCTSVAGGDGGIGSHGHLLGQLQLPARLSIADAGAGSEEAQ